MPLQYHLTLEHRLEDLEAATNHQPIFMPASSGIPVLYYLAHGNSSVTAVDIDQNQFLLLNLLSTAATRLDYDKFMSFVLGMHDAFPKSDLEKIIGKINSDFPFLEDNEAKILLAQYATDVDKREQGVMECYGWLNPKSYQTLRENILNRKLNAKLGEFTTALSFEDDGYFGLIDLSNIREWKYQVSNHGHIFNISRFYELSLMGFDEWDRRLRELCHNKTRKDAIIWEKTFPDYWNENQPPLHHLPYWSDRFVLHKSSEYTANFKGKDERIVSWFYRKV